MRPIGAALGRMSCRLEAWKWGTARVANRQSLEKPPHPVGFREALGGVDQRDRPFAWLAAGKPIGPLEQAEPGEELALRDRTLRRRSSVARHGCKGGEIDVRGDIG